MKKTAILLHNLGGPAEETEILPFLEGIFTDPEIIKLPFSRLLQKPLGRVLARKKAPESRARYRAVGGSPLLHWTRAQVRGLGLGLGEFLPEEDFLVLPAMRCWHPRLDSALEEARAWGAGRILSFSLYPQFSMATTGSSERHMDRCLASMGWSPAVVRISRWHLEPDFLECWAWRIGRTLKNLPPGERDGTVLLFSAHGIPVSFVKAGDPYPLQVESTVTAVLQCLGPGWRWRLAYQGRTGPVRWTGPDIRNTLRKLGREGCRSVLVVPISFVSDHIETLFELDIDCRRIAEASGIEGFHRCPAFNSDPDFLAVLTRLAREALLGTDSTQGDSIRPGDLR